MANAAPPDPFAQLQSLRRRAHTLPEMSMRVALLDRFLAQNLEGSAIFVLDQLVRGSLKGDVASQSALLAVAVALLRREHQKQRDDPLLGKLYEEASRQQRPHIAALALSLPPHQELLDKRALMQGPRFDREVSLGERRWMATRPNPRVLKQLLTDHNPMVVQRLCANPRLQQRDVLQMATRRPTLPRSLVEIALAPRWITQPEVRHALVQNPFSPTGIGLKLLPLLRAPEIDEIAQANNLEPSLHQLAGHLKRLRG